MSANIINKVYKELRTDSQRANFAGLVAGWPYLGEEFRTDDAGMLYSARQLEHVYTEVYEEEWPDLPVAMGEIMPIDTSVHEGSKTWTYFLYSGTTVARWAADFSGGTLPRVTRVGAEVTKACHVIENAYAYTTDDMRCAAKAQDNLDAALGTLTKRGHDQEFHRAGLWGRTELNVDGLLTLPNITIMTAAESFETADVDTIVDAVGTLIDSVSQLTKGLRHATRVLVSRRVRDLLVKRRLGPGDGTLSIWKYLKETFGSPDDTSRPPVEFMVLEELDWRTAQEESDAGVPNVDIDEDTGDCMYAYVHNNAKVLSVVQPMMFTQHPVQFKDLEFQVPCESKLGGVRCPEPMTISRMEGVHF
jgi:hypothetical protein